MTFKYITYTLLALVITSAAIFILVSSATALGLALGACTP